MDVKGENFQSSWAGDLHSELHRRFSFRSLLNAIAGALGGTYGGPRCSSGFTPIVSLTGQFGLDLRLVAAQQAAATALTSDASVG